jgi:hypothetical protein
MKSLGYIIKQWGEANLTDFKGTGTNIHPDDQEMAFAILFDEAVANGFTLEDIRRRERDILNFCVPENPKAMSYGFFYHSMRRYKQILELKFPNENHDWDLSERARELAKSFGIKVPEKKKQKNIIKRRRIILEDDNLPVETEVSSTPIDDTLSAKKASKEQKEKLRQELIAKQLKEELIDPEKALSEVYRLSEEEIKENFIPDLDPEVQQLLGLNDKGEIE